MEVIMYTKHKWESDRYFNFGYVKYLPKDFDGNKKYPLVFFLHGAGEWGDDLDIACRHGFMKCTYIFYAFIYYILTYCLRYGKII